MKTAPKGIPYQGSKEHYMLDIDQKELVQKIISMLEPITPLPKPRKKNTK